MTQDASPLSRSPHTARTGSSRNRRSRIGSNDSGQSNGSGVLVNDSGLNVPAIHLLPGSAPASRASSFRENRSHSPRVSHRKSHLSNGGDSHGSKGELPIASHHNNHRSHNSSSQSRLETIGGRRSSMPNVSDSYLAVPPDVRENKMRRVRSFKTTSKGAVVNRGDSFKKKSTHSLMSTGSAITDRQQAQQHPTNQHTSLAPPPSIPTYYRVIMMGGAGTGKSQLAQQFMTSDYVESGDENTDGQENTVTVLLDGEESTIEFIDPRDRNVIVDGLSQLLDAYVVVFAINDHSSFVQATDVVRHLRVDLGTDRVILLVANKTDLVRKRKVTGDEARLVAETYDCKYTETSAALNHHVDELLVGILTQIRLHMRIPFTTISFPGKESRSKEKRERRKTMKGPRGFFARLFMRGSRKKLKPCENLYTL